MRVFSKIFLGIGVLNLALFVGVGFAVAGGNSQYTQHSQANFNYRADQYVRNRKIPGSFNVIGNKSDVYATKTRQRLLRKGEKYYARGHFEKAAKAYVSLLDTDANDAYANYRLGMAKLNLNQYETGLSFLQTAVSINPELYPAYTGLSAGYIMDGQVTEAGYVLADLNEWVEKCGMLCSENSIMRKSRENIEGMIAWHQEQN